MLLVFCPTVICVFLLVLLVLTKTRISRCSFRVITHRRCSNCRTSRTRRRRPHVIYSSSDTEGPASAPSTSQHSLSRPDPSPPRYSRQSRTPLSSPPPAYSPPATPPSARVDRELHPRPSAAQSPPPPPYIRVQRSTSSSSNRSDQTIRSMGLPQSTSGDKSKLEERIYYSSGSE